MKVKIAKARLQDALAVTRLHRTSIRLVNSKDYTKRELEPWIKNNTLDKHKQAIKRNNFYVTLNPKGVRTGFIEIAMDLKIKEGEILGLYISPYYQRKGVAKSLMSYAEMSYAEDRFKKTKITKVKIESSKTALGFYQKMAYKLIKITKHKFRNSDVEIDSYILEKVLTK